MMDEIHWMLLLGVGATFCFVAFCGVGVMLYVHLELERYLDRH